MNVRWQLSWKLRITVLWITYLSCLRWRNDISGNTLLCNYNYLCFCRFWLSTSSNQLHTKILFWTFVWQFNNSFYIQLNTDAGYRVFLLFHWGKKAYCRKWQAEHPGVFKWQQLTELYWFIWRDKVEACNRANDIDLYIFDISTSK